MASQNKETILQKHQENRGLIVTLPPVMMQGEYDIAADEMMAPLDERIIAATVEALEAGQTHYVDVPGIAPLRESIAAYLNSTTGTAYGKANVIVTAGMQESRFLTIQMIGEGYGRIAVPAVVHPGAAKALAVRPMEVDQLPVDARMLPTLEGIRAALEAGCRLLYLESPSRLTGAVFSAEEVTELAGLVKAYDAAVIWDQGLSVWTEGYTSLAAQSGLDGKVAVMGEAYPGMGLSSLFIGYIAAPEGWIAPMQSQKQIMSICTSTPSQYAALEAGKLFAEVRLPQVEALQRMRASLLQIGLDVIDGAAVNILAVRLSPDQLTALQNAGYTVTNGSDFGAPGVFRLNISRATETALKSLG